MQCSYCTFVRHRDSAKRVHSYHFVTSVLLAQAALHCPSCAYGTHAVTMGHPMASSRVPDVVTEAQHPNQEYTVLPYTSDQAAVVAALPTYL